ncbi:DNA-binding transcriptional regulator, MarR family [Lachnospiraceae bacterium C10]|jgi:DNA-binding MarR family transcriptional regulator|nr:MarR family transcriptional regulator [Lachnospiraceae bacterium]SCW78241.1 DNA-binding transcriptional regulator, MarR family [Lachnospiraceae bacterium C10]SDW65605.1 DNA-binding transcriptional regulator, MarR family [Lachnospiraceae bacterium KHCPX20]
MDNEKNVQQEKYSCLRLENQLCFPLYACAKEVVRSYKPFLSRLDLTYTQYITMMVLWERKQMNVKEIGECLYLDSGTLTPLLKKLEQKGFIRRHRSKEDERNLLISITPEGEALRDEALAVPGEMKACMALDPEDASSLYTLLYKFLDKCQEHRNGDK